MDSLPRVFSIRGFPMPTPWSELSHATAADHAACRRLLRGGSRSFFAASVFLPRHVRDAATALYGFCRVADDAVDLAHDPAPALEDLRRRLERIYAGEPALPVDRAFADVVVAHGIPQAVPRALLEGFEWDSECRRYPDADALEAYAVRVAGTVGVMMAQVMGATSAPALARACDLGVAMQLTNICRDVGEDARGGRLYLPLDWLGEAGIDADQFLARPRCTPELAAVIARVLALADRLYRRAGAGIEALPRRCRPGIRAARWLYAEIGRELERSGLDAVSARTVVPARRRLALLPRTLQRQSRAEFDAPPLKQGRFLVDAARRTPRDSRHALAAGGIARRVHWLVELFHQLEARQRAR